MLLNRVTFVLVRPQIGENIGMTARALYNCGFERLSLVAPRSGWSREAALACSAGADHLIHNAVIYNDLGSAIASFPHVFATTARLREVDKPVFTQMDAATHIDTAVRHGEEVAILLGAERTGLFNEEISLATAIISIPLNPVFSSLNLSQAALLVANPIWEKLREPSDVVFSPRTLATNADYQHLFEHLEGALDAANFWRVPEKKPKMVQNLRALLLRTNLTAQEVQTLHGVIRALAWTKEDS